MTSILHNNKIEDCGPSKGPGLWRALSKQLKLNRRTQVNMKKVTSESMHKAQKAFESWP